MPQGFGTSSGAERRTPSGFRTYYLITVSASRRIAVNAELDSPGRDSLFVLNAATTAFDVIGLK